MGIIVMNIKIKNKAFFLVESMTSLLILVSCLLIFFSCFNLFIEQKHKYEVEVMIEIALNNKLKMGDEYETANIFQDQVPVYQNDNEVWLIYHGKKYGHQIKI